jgi:hypothetical protein
MYLAPLNYDRFFQRVFSNPVIAKRFFEDVLNVVITDFEILPRKNKITDDAAFVEFDFRCRINGKYYILDMQQWYKTDVVKRFYLYFCNNTSLQLETMKPVHIPLPNDFVYKTKNYGLLEPTITLVWMADDTLGFTEDFVAYSIFPENLNDFMQNDALWATKTKEELLEIRKKVLNIANNTHKSLDFLPENRLIFMFQPNIFRNKIISPYFPWFEFAVKTKNKKNVRSDFKKYFNDPIFSTMIEQLKTTVLKEDDFQYITDWESHYIGLANYNEKIRDEALRDARAEQEQLREQLRAQLREQARIELEQAVQKAKAEEKKHTVRNMRLKGFSAEQIADIADIAITDVLAFFKEIDAEK